MNVVESGGKSQRCDRLGCRWAAEDILYPVIQNINLEKHEGRKRSRCKMRCYTSYCKHYPRPPPLDGSLERHFPRIFPFPFASFPPCLFRSLWEPHFDPVAEPMVREKAADNEDGKIAFSPVTPNFYIRRFSMSLFPASCFPSPCFFDFSFSLVESPGCTSSPSSIDQSAEKPEMLRWGIYPCNA